MLYSRSADDSLWSGCHNKTLGNTKEITRLVSDEFFYQGDLEKNELNISPIPMMDRAYKDKLPAMQVDFIDQICLPVYNSLANTSDHLKPMLNGKI